MYHTQINKINWSVYNVFCGNAFKPEFAYATASSGTVSSVGGSSYPDTMQLFFKYPTFVLSTTNATLTRVANSELTEFTQSGTYYPQCLISPGRFDFSRSHRFLYMALTVDQKQVGNMMISALPGQRLFAKLTLASCSKSWQQVLVQPHMQSTINAKRMTS